MVQDKTCSTCKVDLPIDMFSRDSRRIDGRSSQCRECKNKVKRVHYMSNRQRLLGEKKERYQENAEREREKSLKYYYSNKQKVRKRMTAYLRERRKQLDQRLIHNACSRIRSVCKGVELPKSKIKYLGCTGKELKEYLESMFQNGMTWDNYGKVWHVDHKIPLSWFDFSHEGDRNYALGYKNLQPMFAIDNIRKGGRRADVQTNR